MKPATNKIIFTIVAMVLIFSISTAGTHQFGPGLSEAAAELTATLTDVTPLSPDSNAELLATGTRITNILVAVDVNKTLTTPIHNIVFRSTVNTTSSPNTTLHFFDKGAQTLPSMLTIADNSDLNNRLTVTYEPLGEEEAEDTVILCGYNTTDTPATALSAITYSRSSGYYFDDSDPSGRGDTIATLEEVLTVTKTILGDADQDGAVTPSDAQAVLRHLTGNADLSDRANQLAADVNRDGAINGTDANRILDYTVNKILSFWESETIVTLPTEAPTGLVNYGYYYLKNKASGNYLYYDPSYNMFSLIDGTDPPTGYTGLFNLAQASTLFTLTHAASGGTLKANTGYAPSGNYASNLSGSEFWRLVPASGGGYYIVNNANKNRMLTGGLSVCRIDRNLYGSVWELEMPTINFDIYYDSCYAARTGTNAISSITAHRAALIGIFRDVYGINVNIPTPSLLNSYSDLCYGSTAITTNNVSNWCTHCSSQADNGNAACSTYSQTSTYDVPTSGTLHHNNSLANLNYLRSQKLKETDSDIHLMISGHSSCGNEINGTAHKQGNVGGLAYTGSRFAIVFNDDPGSFYYDQLSVLHELSHCLGAGLSPTSVADEGEDKGHTACVMSYEDDKGTVTEAWTYGHYEALYCTSCRGEIIDFIETHF